MRTPGRRIYGLNWDDQPPGAPCGSTVMHAKLIRIDLGGTIRALSRLCRRTVTLHVICNRISACGQLMPRRFRISSMSAKSSAAPDLAAPDLAGPGWAEPMLAVFDDPALAGRSA